MFGKKKENISTRRAIISGGCSWATKEAYNTMRTNVMFSINGKENKVIGVTSAMPHDGKTITAVNLAISLVQIEKKTILIDADMRLPTVANKLLLSGNKGLSNILAGQAELDRCIKKDSQTGLDVLLAGEIPPDPTWLLQSPRFREMIGTLRERYDFIIIDLPPVTTVTDSYMITEHIDGYLLVVRNGWTDLRAVDEMMAQLSMAEARVIGFVNNDVPVRDRAYQYYRFGGLSEKRSWKRKD